MIDVQTARPDVPRHAQLVDEPIVVAYFLCALGYLTLSMFAGLLMALQLVHWNPLNGVELLSPGRWRMVHTNVIAYGFLANAFLGSLHWAVPRLMLKPVLEQHLATYAAPGKNGLVFCGPNGQPLRRATWYSAWNRTMATLGIEGMKPHDLRHTGNTLAAMTGASTKELMARFGQSTSRAALIYQHATEDRDHEIADALNGLIEAKLQQRPT